MVTTTPGGWVNSMMSIANNNASHSGVRRRLSGGEEKVKRYTPGAGTVQTTDPALRSSSAAALTGRLNRVFVDAI